MYQERREVKELFYISNKDKKQYIQDVALLYCIRLRKQRRVTPENITEEKQSLDKSDPKLNLDNETDKKIYNISYLKIIPETTVTKSLKLLLAAREPRSTN